jgi:BarA-like signal transduction histidine kinase
LETFILAIIPASAVYFLMFFHLSITGKNYLAKFKPILIYSLRLTAFLLVVAFIFNWHFTTVLDQHGYGTCWKRSLYSETLYIKDAEECKKRGTEVLRKPRPAYQK